MEEDLARGLAGREPLVALGAREPGDRAGVRREWLSMPYMDGTTERFIWGATAGMLRNFYRFLVA